ncbi:cohesin subunit SA-2-like [Neodiprion fabricii]|uniref:cohesin subunit SA-2-like n=1 Tax=Neodiprion fabricii TaxID=2872261 RepID=UPI001ED96614|nr:cohesin subunit SA-2-like [Neodiprion fabricii]XP_046434146.1 cohesin subunit SA-2-like [Neodiprion fabricii]
MEERTRCAVVRRTAKYRIKEVGLFQLFKMDDLNCEAVAADWLHIYKAEPENAFLILKQFFFETSGCNVLLTPEMKSSADYMNLIREAAKLYDKGSHEYPLTLPGQQWLTLRVKIHDFIESLIGQSQYSVLYDRFLITNIISLLNLLVASKIRAFRHTASFIGMKIVCAIGHISVAVSKNLEATVIRQRRVIKLQNSGTSRAISKIEAVTAERKELEDNMAEIKKLVSYAFGAVLAHCYEDKSVEIRLLCVTEVSEVLTIYPDLFTEDKFLIYLGVSLADPILNIQKPAFRTLTYLYSMDKYAEKLWNFTKSFRHLIISLTRSENIDVVTDALILLKYMLERHRDLFQDICLNRIFSFVYSLNRNVAQIAGACISERVALLDEDADGGVSRNTPRLREVAKFYLEYSKNPDHCPYIVDALIGSGEMIKDWDGMTDLLLDKPRFDADALNDTEKGALIELMVYAVIQSATGQGPIGRGPIPTEMHTPEELQANRAEITEHFIRTLPELLELYKDNSLVLTYLLVIPQYFDLDVCAKQIHLYHVDSLLRKLHYIVERINTWRVLDAAARALKHLCSDPHAIYARADLTRTVMIDETVATFNNCMGKYRLAVQEMKDDETSTYADDVDIRNVTRKISIFYHSHNMTPWRLWDLSFKIIPETMRNPKRPFPHEALKYCMNICSSALLWGLIDFAREEDLEKEGVKEKFHLFRKRLHRFVDHMCRLIKGARENAVLASPILREEAHNSLCKVLYMFSFKLRSYGNPFLNNMIYVAYRDYMMNLLSKYVHEYILGDLLHDQNDPRYKFDRLRDKRRVLEFYCKLMYRHTTSLKRPRNDFIRSLDFFEDYCNEIKPALISQGSRVNAVDCSLLMQYSLYRLYNELIAERGYICTGSKEFIAIKGLAKRITSPFSLNLLMQRNAILTFHKAGVLLALTTPDEWHLESFGRPRSLPLLEILCGFTDALVDADKMYMLKYVEKRFSDALLIPTIDTDLEEYCEPYILYKNSLKRRILHDEPVASGSGVMESPL